MQAGKYSQLPDRELLSKLIGVRECKRVYLGSLQEVFTSTKNEKCLVAMELVRRVLAEDLSRKSALTSSRAVRDYLQIQFAGQEYESFVCLYLDAAHRLISAETLFRGTLTQTSVYPREVVKAALRANAAAVIFAHNHPSGVTEPSRADELLTRSLRSALALVEVQVLDHFIVAGNATTSFSERGLL